MYYLDLSYFDNLFATADLSNPFSAMWFLFSSGGWVLLVWVLLYGYWMFWFDGRQAKYSATITYVLLAIDIPKLNEQNIKAMEQVFAHIAGAHKPLNLVEKYYKGMLQANFSFEIVSIDGHLQFLVHCPTRFRDLVEASLYAQYPGAEITEVADYTDRVPQKWPDDNYKMWGCEFTFYNKPFFPIRTYPSFEYTMDQKMVDPMAALLETMSKIKKGEQIWLQFIISPLDADWSVKLGAQLDAKLLGKKKPTSKNAVDVTADMYMKTLETIGDAFFGPGEPSKKKEKEADMFKMLNLSPGDRDVLTAAQGKLAKIGFDVKIRLIYISKKETYNKGLGVSAMCGAIKQFNTQNMNGLKPAFKTDFDYWFPERRADRIRNRIIGYYRRRSGWGGKLRIPMNIEELASMYHFPLDLVKAPLLQKTESKRGEPPMALPVFEEDEIKSYPRPSRKESVEVPQQEEAGGPPPNLPI